MSAITGENNRTADSPIHANCLVTLDKGILIRGRSGAGKSSLTLKLIDEEIMAGGHPSLVSDDYVRLDDQGEQLWAHPPSPIQGLIEVRGVGILKVPFLNTAKVDLVVDLVDEDAFERFPEETSRFATIRGLRIPRLQLVERNPDASSLIRSVLRNEIAEI